MVIKHRRAHGEVCLIYRARLTICGQQPCRLSYGAAKVTKPPAPQWSCEKNYERLRKERLKLCSSDISPPVITYGNLPVLTDVHNAWELTALDGLTPLLLCHAEIFSWSSPGHRVFVQHREATSPGAKMVICHTCHQDEISSAHFPSWGPRPGHCGQQPWLPPAQPSQVPGWG